MKSQPRLTPTLGMQHDVDQHKRGNRKPRSDGLHGGHLAHGRTDKCDGPADIPLHLPQVVGRLLERTELIARPPTFTVATRIVGEDSTPCADKRPEREGPRMTGLTTPVQQNNQRCRQIARRVRTQSDTIAHPNRDALSRH